jgi:hypothetical protein
MVRSVLLAAMALAATAAPASAAVECQMPGDWNQTTEEIGSTKWTIKANGEATETGGNATGRGDLQGDVLKITFTTPTGYAGVYRWDLEADCTGTGELNFTATGSDPGRKKGPYPSVVTGPAPVESDPCAGAPRARASAINQVRAVAVHPGVQVHKAGTPEDDWVEVCKDTVLNQGDEISCDPDGNVTLQFSDNSTVVVRNTTQLKIASFFTEGGVVKTEILLKMGEVAAKVHKSEATKSDFRIKTPSSGGVRDRSVLRALTDAGETDFSVLYDPGSRASLWSVRAGSVDVTGSSGRARAVGAGQEAFVLGSRVSVGKLGTAGARGGTTIAEARDAVLKVVAKGNGPCKATTPRANAYAIRPAKGGWSATVKVTGKRKGTSKWTVKGRRATPRNALAKRIAKRCT